MTAAATESGVTLSILANQMRRIGVDAGGPLIQRAFRGQPLALTALGADLYCWLSRAFEFSEAEVWRAAEDLSEIDVQRLRHREQSADRRVRWRARLRLAFLVLLVRVARQARTVGDVLRAPARRVRGELACVVTPGRILGFVRFATDPAFPRRGGRYGLIGMAFLRGFAHASCVADAGCASRLSVDGPPLTSRA